MKVKCYANLRRQLDIFGVAGIMLALYISSITTSVHADSINPGVFSKDSSPYGIPYREWIARWWQWNIAIPSTEHPRMNYSPEKCAMDQMGAVWYLADSLTGTQVRTCAYTKWKGYSISHLKWRMRLWYIFN